MPEIIASRKMFIKVGGQFIETTITIFMPEHAEDGLYSCRVAFANVSKYDKFVKGADSINALECSLSYIDAICANSEDPEFHWDKTGGRHKGRPL